jgi:hypothetical protein
MAVQIPLTTIFVPAALRRAVLQIFIPLGSTTALVVHRQASAFRQDGRQVLNTFHLVSAHQDIFKHVLWWPPQEQ